MNPEVTQMNPGVIQMNPGVNQMNPGVTQMNPGVPFGSLPKTLNQPPGSGLLLAGRKSAPNHRFRNKKSTENDSPLKCCFQASRKGSTRRRLPESFRKASASLHKPHRGGGGEFNLNPRKGSYTGGGRLDGAGVGYRLHPEYRRASLC